MNNRLFVYGTLRPGAAKHHLLKKGEIIKIEPGWIQGILFYLEGGYPGLVLTDECNGEKVFGEVVTFADLNSILPDLDEYEDYVPGSEECEYERILTMVQTERGPIEAWVYVVNSSKAYELLFSGNKIDGGDWLEFERVRD
ncbi:hypothetical protein BBF96_03120 [Anoxybacter fermentans]|uniref:Gamma-glutamylcyclotransferase AIG2-like domain-containing protein n=1 Tax=Anoxybacter fermentans TaxID=1323375 RepID=A0A3Q9HQN8_9FIRM|nr:gamma-glutamylcyclotransferase family protein [Anoxybacter fermentans]AZR72459.1 hypothetical protein BBF96_03120 [Anoxybacter fermentans]